MNARRIIGPLSKKGYEITSYQHLRNVRSIRWPFLSSRQMGLSFRPPTLSSLFYDALLTSRSLRVDDDVTLLTVHMHPTLVPKNICAREGCVFWEEQAAAEFP